MTDLGNFDLIVVGGGVNGAGIARDATGRGLSTLLVEKDDIAQGTSSRSGKLVRGGLRYLVRPDHGEVSMRLPDVRVQTRGSPIKVAGQSGDGAQGRNSGFLSNHQTYRWFLVVETLKYQRRYHQAELAGYRFDETRLTNH